MDRSLSLSLDEQQLRSLLEQQVRGAFYQAGRALEQILTQRLYRSTHANFETYCQETFAYTRDYAYLKIQAATVYHHLLENLPTNSRQPLVLPTKQGQLRPIVKARLRKLEQVQVWSKAVDMAEGKVPSSSVVAAALRLYLQENQTPERPFAVREVCRILAREVFSLKKYNGCWCIVSEVRDWECVVNTWDSELVIPNENLESWGLDEWQYQQLEDIGVRMTRLYETGNLDEAALWVLKGLARLNRFYLSPLEENLLRVLEKFYLFHNV